MAAGEAPVRVLLVADSEALPQRHVLRRGCDLGLRGRRGRRRHPDVAVPVLTEGPKTRLTDPWLRVEDKRDLSPGWLAEFWRRHRIVRPG